MRTEISQARKEADFYIENIEKRKVISAMEERKSKKRKKEDKDNGPEQDVEQVPLHCLLPITFGRI